MTNHDLVDLVKKYRAAEARAFATGIKLDIEQAETLGRQLDAVLAEKQEGHATATMPHGDWVGPGPAEKAGQKSK